MLAVVVALLLTKIRILLECLECIPDLHRLRIPISLVWMVDFHIDLAVSHILHLLRQSLVKLELFFQRNQNHSLWHHDLLQLHQHLQHLRQRYHHCRRHLFLEVDWLIHRMCLQSRVWSGQYTLKQDLLPVHFIFIVLESCKLPRLL